MKRREILKSASAVTAVAIFPQIALGDSKPEPGKQLCVSGEFELTNLGVPADIVAVVTRLVQRIEDQRHYIESKTGVRVTVKSEFSVGEMPEGQSYVKAMSNFTVFDPKQGYFNSEGKFTAWEDVKVDPEFGRDAVYKIVKGRFMRGGVKRARGIFGPVV